MEVNNGKFVNVCHRCVKRGKHIQEILDEMETIYKKLKDIMIKEYLDEQNYIRSIEANGKEGQDSEDQEGS